VKNRFQNLPFKFNLQRYSAGTENVLHITGLGAACALAEREAARWGSAR
jgi:cysteine sulfinate desulfinase/cysteine desulfurase-like protein